MAWRIAPYITKGELDNRQPHLITGTLWLTGKPAPIKLELRGNFLRDAAGCLLTFENPNPAPADTIALEPLQIGAAGDITASRKVNVEPKPGGPVPSGKKANALYIEWFSENNGRVVIESTDFRVELSPPLWTMSPADEQHQLNANRESFRQWLEHLSEIEDLDDDHVLNKTERPLNEFEWEKLLKDSDRKNERLGEVLEKYHGHPDSEKLIAREMGWTWVEEEIEAQERGVFSDDEEDAFGEDDEDERGDFTIENREPDPAREGLDWVRDQDGLIEHPLAHKVLHYSAALWREFEDGGQLSETGDSRIFEWVGLVESTGVRLSNALGELAFGEEVDPGYVVAGLKRAVHTLHQALDMLQQLEAANLISPEKTSHIQKTLFSLREDIIGMMKTFRAK